VAKLADVLPKRLTALGVPDATAYKVVQNTAHDARRLGLATRGGHIGAAFLAEWAVMRANPGQWPLTRWPVKAVMLLLVLSLPPNFSIDCAIGIHGSYFVYDRVEREADIVNANA
jgi:hypothetical protein